VVVLLDALFNKLKAFAEALQGYGEFIVVLGLNCEFDPHGCCLLPGVALIKQIILYV
jgi:hypothetical protein